MEAIKPCFGSFFNHNFPFNGLFKFGMFFQPKRGKVRLFGGLSKPSGQPKKKSDLLELGLEEYHSFEYTISN